MPEDIDLPFPFDASSRKSIESYLYSLQYARLKAEDDPFKHNQVLSLKLHCKANPSQASRPLPWFASKEGTYSCKLLRPLQTGPDKYSQVWTASVLPTDGTAPCVGSKIVLKIFQPSLSIIPEIDEDEDWPIMYQIPEELARTEDLAYSEFVNIQGISVPYYYGMQEIETPSGESAWVLAMEYIEGATVAKFVYRLILEDMLSTDKSPKEKNLKVFYNMYRSMAETTRAIVKAEIELNDARVTNFIFNCKNETVVAIDFAQVSFGYIDDRYRRIGLNGVARKFLDCLGPYEIPVQDWVNENMPEDIRGYYGRSDGAGTDEPYVRL